MIQRLLKIYIPVVLLLLFVEVPSSAQKLSLESTPKTTDILTRFESRFNHLDSVIFRSPLNNHYEAIFDSVFFEFAETERVKEVDAQVDAQVKEFKNKTGLELRGQLYVRPGKTLSYDPDDPLVAYNAKAQAELQWNIFNSSIYKRKSKIKELTIQGEIDQLNFIRNDLDEQILFQKQMIRYRHFRRLLSVLTMHAENIDLLMETQVYLLENGKISGEDLLKLINEKSEIERQLISIKVDSVIYEEPAPLSIAYIVKTDTAGIFKSIKENNIELKKLGLRYDLLGLQRNNTDYVQTMDILPFVRYSYYNRENVHNTYNLDVGVSFRIPISAEVSKKKKVFTTQQDVISYQQQILEGETTNGIYLSFHDLEIYNENIMGEYQRMKKLKDYLSMRSTSYYNVDGEYSRINRLQEYNAYLQAWERLLEYSYRRDMILLDLQGFLLTEPISNYIEFKEYN